jgi:hypothetical protein
MSKNVVFKVWFKKHTPAQKQFAKKYLCEKLNVNEKQFDKWLNGYPPSIQHRNQLLEHTKIDFRF